MIKGEKFLPIPANLAAGLDDFRAVNWAELVQYPELVSQQVKSFL